MSIFWLGEIQQGSDRRVCDEIRGPNCDREALISSSYGRNRNVRNNYDRHRMIVIEPVLFRSGKGDSEFSQLAYHNPIRIPSMVRFLCPGGGVANRKREDIRNRPLTRHATTLPTLGFRMPAHSSRNGTVRKTEAQRDTGMGFRLEHGLQYVDFASHQVSGIESRRSDVKDEEAIDYRPDCCGGKESAEGSRLATDNW